MKYVTEWSIALQEISPAWWRSRMRRYWRNQKAKHLDNGAVLSDIQKKAVHGFWDRYRKPSDIFHLFYTQKTGHFHVEYLPDEIYSIYIYPFYNDNNLAKWLDDKSLYDSILVDCKQVIKQPENIVIRSGGYWLTPDFSLLSESQVMEYIKSAGEIFVKQSIDSYGGHGVQYINTSEISDATICNKLQLGGGNVVIQKKIIQHQLLSKLNPSSVNTLRLLSFLKPDGEVKIYSVVLRMGLAGSVVDNASSGGITVGVQDDGRLKDVAYTANGDRFDKVHPDSKVEFSSIVVPKFREIKEAVKRLHLRLPRLRLLSWDFAVDRDETPILIEVNMNRGELDFHQLNNGPLFGEDTETILNEVFGK